MADDIKKAAIKFEANGTAEFQKSLKEVNAAVQENRAAFKLAKSEWDNSTSSAQKLRTQQEYLEKQTETYSQKVELLKEKLEEQESAQERDEAAISKTRKELSNTQATLNNYQKGLDDTNKKLKNHVAELEDAAKKMKEFGDKATKTGESLTKGVTAPIAAVGAIATKTAADFEGSMSQVQATMGITKDAMSKVNGESVNTMDTLGELAKKMGAETAFSASECAQALNYLALAGYDTQQMADTLPTVLNLAAAGDIDLASASDMVTDAMSALGMGVSEAGTMVDQMAKTASSTNTSVAQLGEGILTIGATAKSIKGGTGELNTALGILANNGVKGAEGGTHLRNIILSLQSPVDKAADCIEQLGLQVYDSDGNMRSMNDILSDLNTSMGGMTSEEKNNIISKIFNKTDLSSVNALLANTGSTWDELQKSINDSGGSAQQMADTQLDNLQGQLTILKSSLEGLSISVGEMLMPTIKSLVEWIQNVTTRLNGLDEGQKETVIKIAAIAAAIGPLLIIVGKMATGVSSIITVVKTLTPVFGALNGVMAANPIAIIVIAIVALVAAFIGLWNNCEEFRNFWIGLWDGICGFFSDAAGAISNGINSIGDFFTGLPGKIQGGIDSFKSNVTNGFHEGMESAKEAVSGALSKVNELTGGKLGDAVELARTRLGDMKNAYDSAGGGIKGVAAGMMTGIRNYYKDGFNALDNLTGGRLGNLVKSFSGKFDGIKDAAQNAVSKLKNIFDFNWSLPKIKLPHFSTSGGFSLSPLKVPKFDISWYKNGGILNSPTIFGMNGGHPMGGGEAGPEAVLPIALLKEYMTEVNTRTNAELVNALREALGDVIYAAFVKALEKLNPSIILDDEKVGEYVIELLRKEVFA